MSMNFIRELREFESFKTATLVKKSAPEQLLFNMLSPFCKYHL